MSTPTPRELAAIQASDAKACCKQPEHLVRSEPAVGRVLNQCQVCGCRHFRLTGGPLLTVKG